MEIFTAKKDINELPAGHGLSEVNAPVPPQEMAGSPVERPSLGEDGRRNENA